MKKAITILLMFATTCSYAQVDLSNKFQALYQSNQFDDIIKYKPQKGEELTGKAQYYIALAYFMKEQDDSTLAHLDLALAKGPVEANMYFYKGMTLYYKNKYSEALSALSKAIEMKPNESGYYSAKGEVYYIQNLSDSALYYFSKAAELPDCQARAFLLAGELYQKNDEMGKALNAYESALSKLSKSDRSYQSALYNVGLLNQLAGSMEKARDAYEQVITATPDDYQSMAKLIQTYYSLEQFDKAKLYKAKMYAAHADKKLTGTVKEAFCFDQFLWKGKRVMAFENYEPTGNAILNKHHFYILDAKGKIDYQINSESSAAVRMLGDGVKYVLCLVKDDARFTYWQYTFNDDFDYAKLKKAVIDILDEKVKPSAATVSGKKEK